MVGTNKSLEGTDGEEISATPRKIRRVFRSGRPGENVEPLQTFVRPVGLRKMRLASQISHLSFGDPIDTGAKYLAHWLMQNNIHGHRPGRNDPDHAQSPDHYRQRHGGYHDHRQCDRHCHLRAFLVVCQLAAGRGLAVTIEAVQHRHEVSCQ